MKAKKWIALALALVMVLALAACGGAASGGENKPADTKTETAEFKWNGQKEVWAILPVTGVPGLTWNTDFAMIRMQQLDGWTYSAKDAQGNPSNQVQFVEDAIAAGNVGALIIAAMDTAMLEDVCNQAREKGIAVAMLGAKADYPIAGSVYTQYSIAGMFAVKAAEDWVQKRVAEGGNVPKNADGKYEVAVDTYYNIQDGVYKSNAMVGTVDESDIIITVFPPEKDLHQRSEEEQRAAAHRFVDRFCQPGKPAIYGREGKLRATPAFEEELYNYSRQVYMNQ